MSMLLENLDMEQAYLREENFVNFLTEQSGIEQLTERFLPNIFRREVDKYKPDFQKFSVLVDVLDVIFGAYNRSKKDLSPEIVRTVRELSDAMYSFKLTYETLAKDYNQNRKWLVFIERLFEVIAVLGVATLDKSMAKSKSKMHVRSDVKITDPFLVEAVKVIQLKKDLEEAERRRSQLKESVLLFSVVGLASIGIVTTVMWTFFRFFLLSIPLRVIKIKNWWTDSKDETPTLINNIYHKNVGSVERTASKELEKVKADAKKSETNNSKTVVNASNPYI